jgi:hypothetical protein
MIAMTARLARAIDIAAAFVEREVHLRRCLNSDIGPDEVWAVVALDGRIEVGTPVAQAGAGLYVNASGECREA